MNRLSVTGMAFLALILPAQSPALALAQAPAPQAVVQSETRVVLVNVVAKDKHGKAIEDLKPGDFALRDNDQPQKIDSFAPENVSPASSAAASQPMTFTNRAPGVTAVTAFLFDELNTNLADQELAKKDFLHYLRELPEDSRVAVFVLGDSLALLHDFSQDMASLLAAMEKHTNRVNPEVAAATAPPASANSLTGGVANTAQWDSFIQSSNRPYTEYTELVRATRTAAALATIAGHLQGIPGRKTLVWISGGFPIQLGLRNGKSDIPQGSPNARIGGVEGARGGAAAGGTSGTRGANAPSTSSGTSAQASQSPGQLPGMGRSFQSDVERAIQALNEADVAVYPIDTRGVTVAPAFQANRSSMGQNSKRPRTAGPPDFNYETLETLAEETGGRAFHHINDLNNAIHETVSDARGSYSLTFSPTSASWDGQYHHLELTVDRPDVKLLYRPGYLAAHDSALAPSLAEAIASPISLAGVGFTVHLDPVEGGYKASVLINPRDITLRQIDAKWLGSLQFLVVVGKTEQLTTIPLSLTDAVFRQIQGTGLLLGARVKTPPGTTGFSLGFRDLPSGRVGTLHLPLAPAN